MTVDVATLVFEFKSDAAVTAEERMDRLITKGEQLEGQQKRLRLATDRINEAHKGAAGAAERATQGAMGLATAQGAVEKATQASLTRQGVSWREFVSQRMGDYMRLEGGHSAAMKRIGAEWQAYKATATDAAQGAATAMIASQGAVEKATRQAGQASADTRAQRALEAAAMRELVQATKAYERDQARAAKEAARAAAVLDAQIASAQMGHERLNGTLIKSVGVQKAATLAGLNLSRQFADIGVTAAMGMNPLMILIQQGPQIADALQTAQAQGVSFSQAMRGLGVQLGLVRTVLPPVIAAELELVTAQQAAAASALEVAVAERAKAAGTSQAAAADEAATVAAAALAKANDAVAVTAARAAAAETAALTPLAAALAGIAAVAAVAFGGAALAARDLNKENKNLADGLGLTQKQLDHLKDKGVNTGVTIGDVFRGTFNYIRDALGTTLAPVAKWFSDLFDGITSAAVKTVKVAVGTFVGGFEAIKATWGLLPGAMSDLAIQAANFVINAVESMVNKSIAGLNKLIDFANQGAAKVGLDARLPTMGEVDFGRIVNWDQGKAAKAGETAGAAFGKGFAKGGAAVQGVLDGIGKSITKAAEDRIRKAAGKPGKDPKAAAAPRDQTDERTAQIAAMLAQAMQDELQARLAIAREAKDRADLERQIAAAQLDEKQAQVDRQIANIADDKGLSAAKKKELTDQLLIVQAMNGWTSALKAQAIDEATSAALSRERVEKQTADLENQIDILQAQGDLSKSTYQRGVIAESIREAELEIQRLKLNEVLASTQSTATEKAIAKARLDTLEIINSDAAKAARHQQLVIDSLQDTADALNDFASAFNSHDWGRALSSLANVLGQMGASSGLTSALSGLGAFASLSQAINPTIAKLLGMDRKQQKYAGYFGLIGGLLSGKASNHGAGYDLTTGAFSGSRRDAETEAAAKSTGDAIASFQEMVKAAGIGINTFINGLVIGTRDQTQIYTSTGQTLYSAVGDTAAAVSTAAKAILSDATYASEQQKKVVDGLVAAGKSVDDIVAALQQYEAAQGILTSINDQILQLTDPKAFDLKQVEAGIKAQADAAKAASDAGYLTADQLATVNAQLEVLKGLQIDEVLKRYTDAANDNAKALSDAMSATDGARSDLLDAYNREAQAKQDEIARLKQVISGLQAFDRELRTTSAGATDPVRQYLAAKAEFDRLSALPAGSKERQANLEAVSRTFIEASKVASPTQLDLNRDIAAVRRAVEQSETAASKQIDATTSQLVEMTAAVGQLIELNKNVLTVAQAIANLQAALVAEKALGGPATTPANDNLPGPIQQYIKDNPDLAANFNSGGSLRSAGSTLEEAARAHYLTTGQFEIAAGLRHFASGGMHPGGLRLVGEQGPELEATGPARIYSAAQTRDMLSGSDNSDVVAELRATRAELADVKAELRQIRKHTKDSADVLANVSQGGDSITTVAA